MTQATEALSRNLQQTKRRKAYQFQLLVISKSDDQLWASPVADRARKLVQQKKNKLREIERTLLTLEYNETLLMICPHSIPYYIESSIHNFKVGPSADSGDVSGAMDVNGLIQMLAGQNMVAILAVSMPAPALTGKQGEQSLIGSLQSLTPDDMEDLQTVESMTVHGALGSGLCTKFHLKTRWQAALWAMAEITPN
ncbi:hypothetical protein Q3G72_028446 [Acer saccharum]|nr:hypothetical protein Q3G72_028446 [Acer saccharum]